MSRNKATGYGLTLSDCFTGTLRYDILFVGSERIENSGNASPAIVKRNYFILMATAAMAASLCVS